MEEMKFNPITWFEIYVDDMDRATKFYETVFGYSFNEMTDPTDQSMQMRGFPSDMTVGGASGSLVKMDGMKVGGSNVIVYFGCEDCAIQESRIEAAGGKICQKKMAIGEYGFCSIVTDTEGNSIGLHSMK